MPPPCDAGWVAWDCRLAAEPPRERDDYWAARQRRFWDDSLDRLDDYLDELQTGNEPDGPTKPKDDV